jgi:hypothetical protein
LDSNRTLLEASRASGYPDGEVVDVSRIDELERAHTLLTAAHRYDELRMREALASAVGLDAEHPVDRGAEHPMAAGEALTAAEALELLALGEVLVRKAGYGRQLTVRSARAAGASWTQIGDANGMSKQSAWEAHQRWLAGSGS